MFGRTSSFLFRTLGFFNRRRVARLDLCNQFTLLRLAFHYKTASPRLRSQPCGSLGLVTNKAIHLESTFSSLLFCNLPLYRCPSTATSVHPAFPLPRRAHSPHDMRKDLNPVGDLINGVWHLILDDETLAESTVLESGNKASRSRIGPRLESNKRSVEHLKGVALDQGPTHERDANKKSVHFNKVVNLAEKDDYCVDPNKSLSTSVHEHGVPGTITVVKEKKVMKSRFMANEYKDVKTPEAKINRFMARQDIMAYLLGSRDDTNPKESTSPSNPGKAKSPAHREGRNPRNYRHCNKKPRSYTPERDKAIREDHNRMSHSCSTRTNTLPSAKTPISEQETLRKKNNGRRSSKSLKRSYYYGDESRDPPVYHSKRHSHLERKEFCPHCASDGKKSAFKKNGFGRLKPPKISLGLR